ncbi:mannose-P-dolichol utilization defect 1 protein homolog [Aphis gossypii]|uniref:mannose-P-dolichol utilization defect 1 protein homolog n=1 Tax=Aphis gossypii TaxID=80765 RepID=UPI00100EFBA1|nr:mannose-P-dolichol utilization defect 1 protein homolog [Aphis gossypii]
MNPFTELLHRVALLVLTPKCYEVFFYDLDFFNGTCIRSALSKGLGFGIVGGSLLVKLPQVIKVWQSKSAVGISLVNVCMDLFAVTANVVYSYSSQFPFSSWGDSLFILFQTLLIVILVFYYNISKRAASAFAFIYCSLLFLLVSDIVPNSFLWNAQFISIPLMFYGKMTQGYVNYQNKSTGQLSMATCILLFLGSSVRVFTSIQETGDSLLIWSFALASFANFIIVTQFYCYKSGSPVKTKKKTKKSKRS